MINSWKFTSRNQRLIKYYRLFNEQEERGRSVREKRYSLNPLWWKSYRSFEVETTQMIGTPAY